MTLMTLKKQSAYLYLLKNYFYANLVIKKYLMGQIK